MNKIVAIVGMCGSGKSIASEYYEKLGFKKVYFGELTFEKLEEAGMQVNEENEKYMREQLRKDYGMGVYAIFSLLKIEQYIKHNNVIVDGLYSWDELKILKEKFNDNLVVLAIISDKKQRYDRLVNRSIRSLTNEKAVKRDIYEIENLDKGGPIAFADYYVLNDLDMNKYYMSLNKVMEEILNS